MNRTGENAKPGSTEEALLAYLRADFYRLLDRAQEMGLMVEVVTYTKNDKIVEVTQVTRENLDSLSPVIVFNRDEDLPLLARSVRQ